MKLFRDLREIDRLERKHRRDKLFVDVAIAISGLLAGAALLAVVIYATR